MIIQSTRISRKNGPQFLARHLLDKTDENETIEVLAGDRHALQDAHVLATVKGCTYSIRHLSISPECKMFAAQLGAFVRSIDKEFRVGPDRPRLVVRHVKNGRAHFHIAISEVDPGSLHVLDCRNDFTRLESLARRYERDNGETVQLARAERCALKPEGFSDIARKKAERVSPGFNRSKLKGAFGHGADAFIAEVLRQGLQFADGEKGLILVNGSGAFVAAANRAAGSARAEFAKSMNGIKNDRSKFYVEGYAGGGGKKNNEPPSAPIGVENARRPRSHSPTNGGFGAHSRCTAPASRSAKSGKRTTRPSLSALGVGFSQEHWFLYRLGKVDLDDLLRRAREMADWMQSIFEPQVSRLKRQIQDLKQAQKTILPADASKAAIPAYDYGRRMTP